MDLRDEDEDRGGFCEFYFNDAVFIKIIHGNKLFKRLLTKTLKRIRDLGMKRIFMKVKPLN